VEPEISTAALLPTVHVRFMLPLSVNFGDSIVLCGESAELGYWDPMKAPHFTWSWSGSSDLWILDAELPAESTMECKVVHITAAGQVVWEYTNNRVLEIPSVETMKDGEVTLVWCDQATDVVTPKILSSLASWDEADGSLEGGSSIPFGSLFGFLSAEDDVIDDEVVEEVVAEDSAVEEIVIEDPVVEDEVIEDPVVEPQAKTETIADTIVEETSLSKEAKKNRATATALKNVATAGVFLAGIGGAAALAGVAFDAAIVDTVR
jgi:hypothetical protein